MRQVAIYLGVIIATAIVYMCIVPFFGLPRSKQINEMRTRQLNTWMCAVQLYNKDHRPSADNLYDVFKYYKSETGDDLRLVILNIVSNESDLFDKYNVLEDKKKFIEEIDYEIIWVGNEWFVQEKKNYPRFFRKLWRIDPNGVISDAIVNQEN